ncbi:MAG: hypothetical protein GC206_11875 [Alphaproteobacteria bacterium]|nr:hypothetical protein [Alphaproteobacteria bacterium]
MTVSVLAQNRALRSRLVLLLGAARQYRAAEKAFNEAAHETGGAGPKFQSAAQALIEARETFDELIK